MRDRPSCRATALTFHCAARRYCSSTASGGCSPAKFVRFDDPALNVHIAQAADWGVEVLDRAAWGVIDVASDVVESVDEVADTIGRVLRFVPREHLFVCTNCGLAPMDQAVAKAKLRALAQGAVLARSRYGA